MEGADQVLRRRIVGMSTSLKLGEAEAKLVVEDVLGLVLVKRADEGVYDFDMYNSDGECIGALEVTLATDPKDHAFDAALEKVGPFPARPARRDWSIWLADLSVDMRRIRDEGPEVFAELEKLGIYRFDRRVEVPDEPLASIIKALGISGGMSRVAIDDPEIELLKPGGGGARGPELINQVAVEMAEIKQQQLMAAQSAGIPERHLFIWVTAASSRFLTWLSLWEERAPSGPPPLTPEQEATVTSIWVAALKNSGAASVWRVVPPNGWTCIRAQVVRNDRVDGRN